ncbi:MAG: glycosyltransferase [Verrucomicrobiota bacterium]
MTISVIIPAFNAARWLPSAVASVLAQTRPADELIIVDDASSDSSVERIEAFVKHASLSCSIPICLRY